MDKYENKFGLYFNAKGSNLSSGTTGDLSELLCLIEFKGEFDDEPTAEAIKVVLTEREVYFPENYRIKAPGRIRIGLPRLLPEEKKVVGTYEAKRVGDTYRVVLLENGVFKDYRNGKKREAESKWSISKDGEIHREYKDRNIVVFSINKDESITGIAFIDKEGKRKEAPKDIQLTFKKIK